MSNQIEVSAPSEDEVALVEALTETQEALEQATVDVESLEQAYERDQRIIGALLQGHDDATQIRDAQVAELNEVREQLRNAQRHIVRMNDLNRQMGEANNQALEVIGHLEDKLVEARKTHAREVSQRDDDISTLVGILQSLAHEHPTLLANVPSRFLDGWPIATPREKVPSASSPRPVAPLRVLTETPRPEPNGARIIGVDTSDKPDYSVCSIEGSVRHTHDDIPPHHNS